MNLSQTNLLDFSFSIVTKSDSKSAFAAISNGLSEWWGNMSNSVSSSGDIFTVSWGEPWYRFKVLEFNPDENLIWKCIDSNQIIEGLLGVEKEWVGTVLSWRIIKMDTGEIEIRLTHNGLNPSLSCYNFCSSVWSNFLTNNLKEYLENQSNMQTV